MQPLKIAILSTSRIVEEFLQHLAEMPEISVQALCCRPQSGDKARAWAQPSNLSWGALSPPKASTMIFIRSPPLARSQRFLAGARPSPGN